MRTSSSCALAELLKTLRRIVDDVKVTVQKKKERSLLCEKLLCAGSAIEDVVRNDHDLLGENMLCAAMTWTGWSGGP